MTDINVETIDTMVDAATRTATRRRTPRDASSVRDIKSLVRFARTITPANFDDMLAAVNAVHGPVSHAARNIGRFSRVGIQTFQNESLRDNAEWQLNDVQLLFVWRVEHPAGVGLVYRGIAADGVRVVRGVRADYNRTGHGAKFTIPAPSVAYGPARFDWPSVDAAKTA